MTEQLDLRDEGGWRHVERQPDYADEGLFRLMAAVCLQKSEETGQPSYMEWEGVMIEIRPIGLGGVDGR